MGNQNQLLLLQDVDDLGNSGDIVTVKPGYARNYLVPRKKAVYATKHALLMQARLKEERQKQAKIDREESEKMAERLKDVVLSIEVKVDPEGKMYGSVTSLEVVKMLSDKGFEVERRNIVLPQAIKETGSHSIPLKLKEGIQSSVILQVIAEGAAS